MQVEGSEQADLKIRLIYFSPTNTTKKVLQGIAQGIKAAAVAHLDLTPPGCALACSTPESKSRALPPIHNELAIIGAPVYSGRIPGEAAYRLRRLKAHNTPAVIVVVYGNRAYEDALLELRELATEIGCTPIAGGAFIGEHSFSIEANPHAPAGLPPLPIARGRPDVQDLEKAKKFGAMVESKVTAIKSLDTLPLLDVPGNIPYRERHDFTGIAPVTYEDLCTKCEECAALCPTAAITVADTVLTEPDACIQCCACIKGCPTGARVMEDPHVKKIAVWLYENYRERKEPEIYL
jgi:ferredoxin